MRKEKIVRISQPHVEQLHMYLNQALEELDKLKAESANTPSWELIKRIDEVAYLVTSARQSLPPRQIPLALPK